MTQDILFLAMYLWAGATVAGAFWIGDAVWQPSRVYILIILAWPIMVFLYIACVLHDHFESSRYE